LKEIIKSFFNKEYNLNIETVETSQKPDGLVQKIKTMFDGEEVR